MWTRLLRLLQNGLNLYSFYSNPVRFLASLLTIIIVPYLAYLFWGTLIIVALMVLGIYFIYKAIKAGKKRPSSYS
ncbi:MAG TPA: hypothetical protein VJ964_07115 [Balneolaceae bacterium]|nr:hypothetical protein [Balneolaceae bacterium]